MEHRTSGKAIASLVCGILSNLMPVIGIVLGIIGIVFGVRAKKEIQHSNGTLTGDGMATAGFICGIVGTVVSITIILIIIIVARHAPVFWDGQRWV